MPKQIPKAERPMLPKNFLRKFPNNSAVLETFTDYHPMFRTQPPFKEKTDYFLGGDFLPFKRSLTHEVLDEAFSYYAADEKSYWSARKEIANLKELQRLMMTR